MTSPNYVDGTGAFSTVLDVSKTIAQLQADDHQQTHRNMLQSKRSTFERSLTISVGDDYDSTTPQTLPLDTPIDFVCNGEITTHFIGPTEALWNPTTNRIVNLIDDAFYYVTLNVEVKPGLLGNNELACLIIDAGDGVTVLASAVPIEMMSFSNYLYYQALFAFLTPAGTTGKTFKVEIASYEQPSTMGGRGITIYRER